MKKIALLCCIILVAGFAACKQGAAPTGTGAAAAPQITEVESFVLTKAFAGDEAKALAEYQGKRLKLKNVAIDMVLQDEKKLSGFAFDPATKTITTDVPATLKGEAIKSIGSGDSFFITLLVSDPTDLAKVKDVTTNVVEGKNVYDYDGVVDVEGTFDKVEGNDVTLKDVKIIKK